MNYNYQLNNISVEYRKFSKGQAVEETQFNEFLDFFEDQDRLSRVLLKGVGVVCGFRPQPVYTNKRISSLIFSQGVAITTDGDLLTLNNKSKTPNVGDDSYMSELKNINLDGKEYTHWKVYDNYKVKYPAFHNPSGDQVVGLWELATKEEATAGFQPLSSLKDLENKHLLLYLESYEKEVRPCRGVDCDNHGIQQIRNLKVLVTTADGIKKIIDNDQVFPERMFFNNLIPERRLKRVILSPELASPQRLKDAYKEIIAQSDYGNMFRHLDIISGILKIPGIDRSGFIDTLNNLADQNANFQYAYGVLKDLMDTYAEIIALLPKSFTKCFPDLLSFPKHIMLGKIVPVTRFDQTRHQFYNTPVLDNEKITLRVRTLLERCNQMVLAFRNPAAIGAETGIRVTPSQEMKTLSEQAIPFYYTQSEKLINLWNFDKTKNRASKTNLSYERGLLSTEAHIQMPLKYNLDNKSFFVIEGHQGLDYHAVVNHIRDLKDKEQLGIDVMALSMAELRDNKDLMKAYFADYVEKNPGMEHKRGAGPGDTFVVVYEDENNPAVIADFTLPYVCCTPKSNVALSLPASSICIDGKPMIFTVTPPNGTVKADVAQGLTGGVQHINGQYLFNPGLVEEALIGQEIRFTVNGKPTSCVATVVTGPNVVVQVAGFEYPEGGASNTVVTFHVSGSQGAELDYKWDFLGNGSYVSIKPDADGNVKYNFFKIDPRLPVNVLVTGNGCSQHITLTNWYVPEPVENNQPPRVAVMADQTELFLPDAETTLSGMIVPGNGTVNHYQWTCTDSNVVFGNANGATTAVSFPYSGVFTFTLTVKDTNNLQGADSVTVRVGTKARITEVVVIPGAPTINDEVRVEAVTFNPSNVTNLRYDWYLDGQFLERTITNVRSFGRLAAGQRRIEVALGDSDGGHHVSDIQRVLVTVIDNNRPPTVSVNTDLPELYFPDNGAKLFSSVTPGSGTVNQYQWSCPDSNVVFTDPNQGISGVIFPYPGTFVITLTVKDTNNLTASASLTIRVGTKASITDVIIQPLDPTTNDEIIAWAVTSNPSNITGLTYDWYLDGDFVETTASDTRSFGRLTAGERRIEAVISNSDGGHHATDMFKVYVTIREYNSRVGTSFLEGTKITLANGSKKNIEEVKVGDRLKSYKDTVEVTRTVTYLADTNLYRLNDERHFITGPHPVQTVGGWKSYEPEKSREIITMVNVEQLQLEDMLIREGDQRDYLRSNDFISGIFRLYNLEVNGTRDYYANGYLVYSEIEPEV